MQFRTAMGLNSNAMRYGWELKKPIAEHRRLPPTMVRHLEDDRKNYILKNQEKWTLVGILMRMREKEMSKIVVKGKM